MCLMSNSVSNVNSVHPKSVLKKYSLIFKILSFKYISFDCHIYYILFVLLIAKGIFS